MKKSILFVFVALLTSQLMAQVSENMSLYAQWDDTNVVAEPIYNIRYNSVWGWKNTTQNKEYAILGASSGTYFIDVSNPAAPVKCDFVAGRRGNCIWREFKTYSHYAYLVSDDAAPNSFQIVDLNYLPDSVHVVYDSDQLFRTSHTIFIDGSRMYCGYNRTLTANYSMAVYDLAANPELPVFLRSLNQDDPNITLVHDMFVRNDTVYASCGTQGLYLYKFTGTNFVPLGSLTNYPFSGYNHSSAMAPGSTKMVFCDEVPTGLPAKIIDVAAPNNINFYSTFSSGTSATPHNPYMLGENVVIAYYQDGVQIFDITDPNNVVRSGYYDTSPTNCPTCPNPNYSGCWGAYVDLPSGIILASDMQNGLFILNADSSLIVKKATIDNESFTVFPNPVQDKLTFVFKESSSQTASLQIIDRNGRSILNQQLDNNSANKHSIPTENLSQGLYLLKVTIGTKQYIKKFAKL